MYSRREPRTSATRVTAQVAGMPPRVIATGRKPASVIDQPRST